MALGFLAGLGWTRVEANRRRLDPERVGDVLWKTLLAGLLGGRLLYVALNGSYFLSRPWDIFKIWEGGLVWYGGLALGGAVGIFLFRKMGLNFLQSLDLCAPGLALAHGLGRVGCFFAGCCYGRPTHAPWGVTFNDPHSLAPGGMPLHPTQLYESFLELLLFGVLAWLSRRKSPAGTVGWSYLLGTGLVRFFVEFFRDDPRGPVWMSWPLTQWMSVGLILAGLVGISKGYARRHA